MLAPSLRRLAGVDDLLELAPDDPYVLAEADPARVSSTWAGPDGALGWVVPSRRVAGAGHLVALGSDAAVGALLTGVLGALAEADPGGPGIGSVGLPRDADRALHPAYALEPRNDWEWFSTTDMPAAQPGEAGVHWLGDDELDAVRELLATWSPRHDAVPSGPGVLRWCGVRDGAGRLVATAAHTEHRSGVPRLASMATAGDVRGRGLGAAVTAWLTRRLLEEGTGIVTLGMYSDNAVARRIYERLGYVCAHAFTSGRLVPTP